MSVKPWYETPLVLVTGPFYPFFVNKGDLNWTAINAGAAGVVFSTVIIAVMGKCYKPLIIGGVALVVQLLVAFGRSKPPVDPLKDIVCEVTNYTPVSVFTGRPVTNYTSAPALVEPPSPKETIPKRNIPGYCETSVDRPGNSWNY